MGKGIELDDLKKKYKNTSEVYSRICQYESRGNKMMMPILSICETNFISKGKIEIDIGRFIVPQGFYYLEGTELERYLDENLVKNNAIKIDINRFQVADAIELKYPLNGQYPEQMYSFIKDIKFMEQLKEAGFDGAYCVTLVQDKNFYSGNKVDGVYSYFRNGNTIHGTIIKPTGKKDESIDVYGEYQVEWKSINNWKYYIVDAFPLIAQFWLPSFCVLHLPRPMTVPI